MVDFDSIFMHEAYKAALKSTDPRTQVGACVVDKNNNVVMTGCNNPCAGDYVEPVFVTGRTPKAYYYEHAERNCFYAMARLGIASDGCSIYCTMTPCNDCARAMVQSGIANLILHCETPGMVNDSQYAALKLFQRVSLPVRYWSGNIDGIEILIDGVLHRTKVLS